MYSTAIILLVGGGLALVLFGAARRSALPIVAGALLAAATWGLFTLMDFWGEMLWFQALGQGGRFWRAVGWKLGSAGGGGLAAGLLAFGLTWSCRRRRILRAVTIAAAALLGLAGGLGHWQTVAMFLRRAPTGLVEPMFGRTVGFYLFVLPLLDALRELLLWVGVICLIGCAAGAYVRIEGDTISILGFGDGRRRGAGTDASLYLSAAAVLAAWSWGEHLARYHLLYSRWGAVTGAGWTDVHARLPGYWITCVATGLLAVVLVARPARRRLLGDRIRRRLWQGGAPVQLAQAGVVGAAMLGALAVRLVVLGAVPGLLQWLRVEPNEITFEKPYIARNIRFTRRGFGLHEAEEREFPATGRLTAETVEANRAMFDNVRLWDYRALAQVYSQFQEIRLYYEFADVDIDRYTIDGRYRQAMISARELKLANLPSASRTFVNRHFKYTHGNGVTLTTVSDFTPQGLPDLLIKDIPPVSRTDSLDVRQPRIYYGELTTEYAVVNTREREFDYPRGQENVYVRYDGSGGVRLSGFWRRLVYGWKLGGTRLLLSGYPTSESRIMFRRDIRRRVRALAPFLRFDRDPYVVLAAGKLYWVLDAYTTSTRYPYSEPFDAGGMGGYGRAGGDLGGAREVAYLHGVNYIRNSVKAVIDAYDGSVRLYVMAPSDPLVRTWERIFPGLFRARDQMPAALFSHVRYPADLLLVQGLVYAKYHMTDPEVFYNLEDLWVRATEKYYQRVQPVQPYYILWRPPEADGPEYVLMLPFTPKNKQVLIGWIAGMCDGENYGRFLAYRFPKERRLLGPQQVETKVDQDPHLSGQLTLWDQRGSKVIRGNVLAIPVAGTLLYVEPIYIQAETAAYPELRLVVVMHNDRLSYAETFEGALAGLFEAEAPSATTRPAAPARPSGATPAELIRAAGEAFDDYQRFTGEGDFEGASRALQRLRDALRRLRRRALPAPSTRPAP